MRIGTGRLPVMGPRHVLGSAIVQSLSYRRIDPAEAGAQERPTMTTTQDNQLLAEGIYAGEAAEGMIVLALPGTDYRHHLVAEGPVGVEPGRRLAGRIYTRAQRVDIVRAGGRFVEPVFGRPRRVQGRVLAIAPAANTITVHASCPITCELTARQSPRDFQIGQLVSFDVERGARFAPALGSATPASASSESF